MRTETVQNLGVLRSAWSGDRGGGMKWRVVMEVTRADGAVRVYEIGGGASVDEYSPGTVGLTLAQGKLMLAGLQHHLVQAQTEDHCRRRRRCGAPRPIKDKRSRRLSSLFGTVKVSAPRFEPCRCAVTRRQTLSPVSEIMLDQCTPEYERVVAKMGASLPYRRARTLLSEFLPLDDIPSVETVRQRTIRVGARLEKAAVTSTKVAEPTPVETKSIALSIDGGHVRSVRHYQVRSFEVLLAQVTNDDGKQIVFSSVPAKAISQQDQLCGVLHILGATAVTPVTILSDGAKGPRTRGEAASPGPTHHVLDWFHLSMRIQHVDQAAKSWPDVSGNDRQTGADLVEIIDRIRWRLWHGQVARTLDLIGGTLVTLDSVANCKELAAVAARKVARLLRDLETYICGQSDIIIDYATARHRNGPMSTAVTESTVQWLLHRRMATGTPERPVPIPGWTLPGVMTVGAAQIALKTAGLVPSAARWMAGQGPPLLLYAVQALRAGGRFAGVLDLSRRRARWAVLRHLPRAASAASELRKGLLWRQEIKRAGVKWISASEVRAEGDAALDRVRFRADGREHDELADLLLLHDGVIPSVHITRALGLAHVWDVAQRCWKPATDGWGVSSLPNLLVAGDGAGVGGALAAGFAGRLAALGAACALGRIDVVTRDAAAAPLRAARARHLALRPFLDALHVPRLAALDDATLVCRCEEVSAGQIRQAVRIGALGLNQLKAFTRCGMGPYQGRMCGATAAEVMAAARGVPVAQIEPLRTRFPTKPLTLGELAALNQDA